MEYVVGFKPDVSPLDKLTIVADRVHVGGCDDYIFTKKGAPAKPHGETDEDEDEGEEETQSVVARIPRNSVAYVVDGAAAVLDRVANAMNLRCKCYLDTEHEGEVTELSYL